MALLYVQESGLRLLDGAVTLFTVGVSGLCVLSVFFIYEACPESKNTKVLNMYIFNLQNLHCKRIACQ